MTSILIRRGGFGQRNTGRMPCDDGGRDRSDVSELRTKYCWQPSEGRGKGMGKISPSEHPEELIQLIA